jgi:hypothetical protein
MLLDGGKLDGAPAALPGERTVGYKLWTLVLIGAVVLVALVLSSTGGGHGSGAEESLRASAAGSCVCAGDCVRAECVGGLACSTMEGSGHATIAPTKCTAEVEVQYMSSGATNQECNGTFRHYSIKIAGRRTFIGVPLSADKQGAEKVPWVMSFAFDATGVDANAGSLNTPVDPLDHCHQGLLQHGIGVVVVPGTTFDNWYYMPDQGSPFYDYYSGSAVDAGKEGQLCWSFGNNPDAQYLKELVAHVARHPEDYRFDFAQFGVIGMAVGAEMASRAMEEFPKLMTRGTPPTAFPTINCAALISGGSMYCYAYDEHADLPDLFSGCPRPVDFASTGCCPVGLTETSYSMGLRPYASHPAVLLVQNTDDKIGDTNASTYYFEAMKSNESPACLLRWKGRGHVLPFAHVSTVVSFLVNNISPDPARKEMLGLRSANQQGSSLSQSGVITQSSGTLASFPPRKASTGAPGAGRPRSSSSQTTSPYAATPSPSPSEPRGSARSR